MLEAACEAFEELSSPGRVIDLPMRWAEDDVWKAEFKLDELRDAVVDQVCTLESV